MTKQQNWLGVFLILQLGLAIGLYWSNLQSMQSRSPVPLVHFDKKKINRITIDSEGKLAELIRDNDQWGIASLDGLPANNGKINALIDKLQTIEQTWPIATSDSSQKRFEVSSDQFQRRVKLFQNDELVDDLLIGTSPGFRKTHVRRSDDDAIYSVSLNHHELPAENDRWLDKKLLSLSDFSSIKAADFSLIKNNSVWEFDPADESVELAEEKVNQLVSDIASLQILNIEQSSIEPPTDTSLVKALQVTGQSSWLYEFFKKNDKHYIRRNDIDHYFLVTKVLYDRITSVDKNQLTKITTENDEFSEPETGHEKS